MLIPGCFIFCLHHQALFSTRHPVFSCLLAATQDLEDEMRGKSQYRSKRLTTRTSTRSFWAPSIPSLHEHRAEVFKTDFSMPPKVRADLNYTGCLEGPVPKPGNTRCPIPQGPTAALYTLNSFPYPPSSCSHHCSKGKQKCQLRLQCISEGWEKIASGKGEL